MQNAQPPLRSNDLFGVARHYIESKRFQERSIEPKEHVAISFRVAGSEPELTSRFVENDFVTGLVFGHLKRDAEHSN